MKRLIIPLLPLSVAPPVFAQGDCDTVVLIGETPVLVETLRQTAAGDEDQLTMHGMAIMALEAEG